MNSILDYFSIIPGCIGAAKLDNGYRLDFDGYSRMATEAEVKAATAEWKREQIYREQEIRSVTVYGKEVDRFFFAWIEELYSKILKPASRNAIDATNTPITNGLKLLRDNRNTLLNGLQSWVDDPLKTAEDIAAFDVSGWSGWSVARP